MRLGESEGLYRTDAWSVGRLLTVRGQCLQILGSGESRGLLIDDMVDRRNGLMLEIVRSGEARRVARILDHENQQDASASGF